MRMGGQRHAPASLRPGKEPGIHGTRGCACHRDVLGGCGKTCPLPAFDLRTVQLADSHYTDYAVPAHTQYNS
jgi:hypothetical protein